MGEGDSDQSLRSETTGVATRYWQQTGGLFLAILSGGDLSHVCYIIDTLCFS